MTFTRTEMDKSAMSTQFNKDSKACIPKYNIKTSYTQNLSPFFSPKKGRFETDDKIKKEDQKNDRSSPLGRSSALKGKNSPLGKTSP